MGKGHQRATSGFGLDLFWIPNCPLPLSWGIPLNTVQVWKKTLPIPGLVAWKSQAGRSVQQRFKSHQVLALRRGRALENAHGALGTSASLKKQEAVERLGTTWTGGEELPPPPVLLLQLYWSCASTTNKASIKEEQLVRGSISALAADFPVFSWSALCVWVCSVGL